MEKYHSVFDWEQIFRSRIRKLLKRDKLTAKELSRIIEKEDSYISRMLNMRINPSMKSVFDIIYALNMTPEEFFAFYHQNVDEEIKYLTYRISRLTKSQQKGIITILESYEEQNKED